MAELPDFPQEATDRLRAVNGGIYHPKTNPYGLGMGGHRQLIPQTMDDVADTAAFTGAAAAIAGEAAKSATADAKSTAVDVASSREAAARAERAAATAEGRLRWQAVAANFTAVPGTIYLITAGITATFPAAPAERACIGIATETAIRYTPCTLDLNGASFDGSKAPVVIRRGVTIIFEYFNKAWRIAA